MIRSAALEIEPDPAFASALCAQTDPKVFFPPAGGDPGPAKRICARCPARRACLEYALSADLPGVWGGTTRHERARMRRDRRRDRRRDTP